MPKEIESIKTINVADSFNAEGTDFKFKFSKKEVGCSNFDIIYIPLSPNTVYMLIDHFQKEAINAPLYSVLNEYRDLAELFSDAIATWENERVDIKETALESSGGA
jgi:hypothetical protein